MARKPTEVYTRDHVSYAPCCPACGAAVALQATVEAMDTPPGWAFFGRKGERWIKCHAFSGPHEFIHFVTLLNGRYSHRLAWIVADDEQSGEQRSLF